MDLQNFEKLNILTDFCVPRKLNILCVWELNSPSIFVSIFYSIIGSQLNFGFIPWTFTYKNSASYVTICRPNLITSILATLTIEKQRHLIIELKVSHTEKTKLPTQFFKISFVKVNTFGLFQKISHFSRNNDTSTQRLLLERVIWEPCLEEQFLKIVSDRNLTLVLRLFLYLGKVKHGATFFPLKMFVGKIIN